MPDVQEVFRMATQKVRPEPGFIDRQYENQRRQSRRRKAGALALVAALVIAGVVIGISTLGSDDVQPANSGANPTLAPKAAEQTLSIVDVGTGTATAFTAPPGASDSKLRGTWFDFTLDGSMVAYSDLDEDGNAQVFVMDADGSNAEQLTHGEGGVGDYGGFDWSPDGSMIAYERDTADGPQIFTVHVRGSAAEHGISTRVTNAPRGAVSPGGWAPDGGSIIFSTINTAGNHYTAQSLDLTTGQTRLIVPDGSTPELSPDGAWIAFNSWLKPDPLVRLMLANSDGSDRRVIARLSGDDGYEQWSPDSTKIAFVADIDENGFGTHIYDLATGETRFVTDGTIESWVDNDHILVS
jgi:Tol biopolymer transport system component